jgi:hypothetical protein
VFLLFRGVKEEQLGDWAEAAARARGVDWASVVGVDPRMADESLFRVLEWGGMEVL